MKLHPQILKKEGKREFVVLPFDEYEALTSLVEDYEDLKELREEKRKSQGQQSVPLEKVMQDLGL